MKKHDIILLVAIIIVLLPVAIILLNLGKGGYAVVKLNGRVMRTISLDKDGLYGFAFDNGYNKIEVRDGKVRVFEADCPNQDCVNKGYIDRNGESIICLPHKFEVTIKSKDDDYDVIVN